jgi:hypothetical protein
MEFPIETDKLTAIKSGEGGYADWISFHSAMYDAADPDEPDDSPLQDIRDALYDTHENRPMQEERSILYKRAYGIFAAKVRAEATAVAVHNLKDSVRRLLGEGLT